MILGVVGGSGSGKTHLAMAIRDHLGPAETVLLHQDSYYRDLSSLPFPERAAQNFDAPDALDLALMAEHVTRLKAGRSATPPLYEMATHLRTGLASPLAPAPLILVEGPMIAAEAILAAVLDRIVYVDLPEVERYRRRLQRDRAHRGRTDDAILAQWREWVLPMHRRYVRPVRETADLVVAGDAPPEETVALITALL